MGEFALAKQSYLDANKSKRWLRKAGRLSQVAPGTLRQFRTQPCAGVKFTLVGVGEKHVVAVSADNRLYAWGLNTCGQLGRPLNSDGEPVQVVAEPTPIDFHPFSEDNQDYFRRLYHLVHSGGDLSTPPPPAGPSATHKLHTPHQITQLSVGSDFCAIVTAAGELYTWGCGDFGKLAQGSQHHASTPTLVSTLLRRRLLVQQVSCGHTHMLARTVEGYAFACGDGRFGKLGLGQQRDGHDHGVHQLERVVSLCSTAVVDVSAGRLHSLAVGANGLLYSCGKATGALGHGEERADAA
jgi:alpha-tubulin suppressor-like RCC1 family protein